jgi:hypothetical protein
MPDMIRPKIPDLYQGYLKPMLPQSPCRRELHLAGTQQSSANCDRHSDGTGSNTRASGTTNPCFPSRIASTMSGVSNVKRSTRVIHDIAGGSDLFGEI